MKKLWILTVILVLVLTVGMFTGCMDKPSVRFFDDGNIQVIHGKMKDDYNENDYLGITIWHRGNYTIIITYDNGKRINSETISFQVTCIPYQYRFERYTIDDYELAVLEKVK